MDLVHLYLAFLIAAMHMVASSTIWAANDEALVGTLLVVNKGNDSVSLVDLADGRAIGSLPTGRGPHELVVSADGRLAVVTDYAGGNSLTLIDVVQHRVARTVDLSEYPRPHGIAFMPGEDNVAVTAEAVNRVLLVSVTDGTVVESIGTQATGSHMLAVTADGSRVYTSNMQADSVSELDMRAGRLTRQFSVPDRPEAIAATADGAEVWVGSNEAGVLSVIRLADGSVETVARGFGWPYRILISPNQQLVLVPDLEKSVLRVFDRVSRIEQRAIELPGGGPQGLTFYRGDRWLLVSLNRQDRVALVDLNQSRAVKYFDTGPGPDGIAYTLVRPDHD